jgi:phage tail protein X
MTTYQTKAGDTVDYVCWMYYGATAGIVETVLATNSGLADYGPVLPAGINIMLPVVTPSTVQDITILS